jgi:hypothetical protein
MLSITRTVARSCLPQSRHGGYITLLKSDGETTRL